MTTRTRTIFVIGILMLALLLMACDSTLLMTNAELYEWAAEAVPTAIP